MITPFKYSSKHQLFAPLFLFVIGLGSTPSAEALNLNEACSRLFHFLPSKWTQILTFGRPQDVFVPTVVTSIEQMKQVGAKTSPNPYRRSAEAAGLLNERDQLVYAFFERYIEAVYRQLPNAYKGMQTLLRLTGTPVNERMVAVPGTGGSASMKISDFPTRYRERLAQSLGPILKSQTSQLIEQLGLNSDGVRWSNGVLTVRERSGSRSGLGIVDQGLHHPGLDGLISGSVPGFTIEVIERDDSLSRTSPWGGRYSITVDYILMRADKEQLNEAEASLPGALLSEALTLLHTTNIVDPDLNSWIEAVGRVPYDHKISWYESGVDTISIREFQYNEREFALRFKQFLFEKGLISFTPTTTRFRYGNYERLIVTDPSQFVDADIRTWETESYFRTDKPFFRPTPDGKNIHVFGHLEASADPTQNRDNGAVRQYLKRSLQGDFTVSNIQIADEGQFSADVSFFSRN